MKGTLGLGCEQGALLTGCDVAKQDLADFVSWGIDLLKGTCDCGTLPADFGVCRTACHSDLCADHLAAVQSMAARPCTLR